MNRVPVTHSTGRGTVAILAHRGDTAALALANLLRRRGECQVSYADEIAIARARVVHYPASGPILIGEPVAGSMSEDRLVCRSGPTISPATSVVLCRLTTVSPARQANPVNQAYAEAETFAYALSWLAGLGDAVVNRPTPMGLTGSSPDLIRLHRLACGVGLSVPRFTLAANGATAGHRQGLAMAPWSPPGLPYSSHLSDSASDWGAPVRSSPPLPQPTRRQELIQPLDSVLVAGERVVGAPPELVTRLVALVEAAGLRMAEVTLGVSAFKAEPVVTGLNPVPSLSPPQHLDAAASFIEHLAGVRARAARSPSTLSPESTTAQHRFKIGSAA